MNYLKYFHEFILYSIAWLWYRKTVQGLFWAQTSCLWFKQTWSFDVKWEASSPVVRWPRLLRYWLLGQPWCLVGQLVQSRAIVKVGEPCIPWPLATLSLELLMLDLWWNPTEKLVEVHKGSSLKDMPILESKWNKHWWLKSTSKT